MCRQRLHSSRSYHDLRLHRTLSTTSAPQRIAHGPRMRLIFLPTIFLPQGNNTTNQVRIHDRKIVAANERQCFCPSLTPVRDPIQLACVLPNEQLRLDKGHSPRFFPSRFRPHICASTILRGNRWQVATDKHLLEAIRLSVESTSI